MSQPSQDPPVYAEWGQRVGALLLDSLIVGLLSVAAVIGTAITAVPFGATDEVSGSVFFLLWFVIGSAYVSLMMSRKGEFNGQTLGRQAAGVRVVRDDGRPITFGFAVLRDVVLKFVLANVAFLIGWIVDSLWALGEKEKRTLHDLAVGTHVISARTAPVPQLPQTAHPVAARPMLAPPIARHVEAAHRIQASIAAAVHRAELPYTAVSREVDALIGVLDRSAVGAQLLYEALVETPVASVEERIATLTPGAQPELESALQEQLVVQRRMLGQYQRCHGELERIVVELDTVRANLISTAASSDVQNQERLAESVRGLRDEMGAVAEGMDTAYRT